MVYIIFFTCHYTETTRHCLVDTWSIFIVIYWPGHRLHNGINLYMNNGFQIYSYQYFGGICKAMLHLHKTTFYLQLIKCGKFVFVLMTFVQHCLDAILILIASFHGIILVADGPFHKLQNNCKHVNCYSCISLTI